MMSSRFRVVLFGVSFLFLLLVGLAAQSASVPVTLKIVLPGERPVGMDLVVAEVEKQLAKSLHVKLDVVFVLWGELAQKTQVMLTSGEPVDLIFDAPWLHINQMISKGYYEPLDKLLARYGRNITKVRPKLMWDSNKFQGKVMGIPLGVEQLQVGRAYVIRKDIREKLGIPPIKTREDFINYLYAVKSKTKLIPYSTVVSDLRQSPAMWRVHTDFKSRIRPTPAKEQSWILYFKANDGKVHNMFDEMEPKIWDAILEARKLYKDGIIDPDNLTRENQWDPFLAGKIGGVSGFLAYVQKWMADILANSVPGAKAEIIHTWDPADKAISSFQVGNFICLSTGSKNKVKAIQFLDWTNKSQAHYDLLAYGIKDKHWKPVGADSYEQLNNDYPWFPFAWIRNPVQERFAADMPEDILQLWRACRDAKNFTPDIITGFSFDPTPVTNELAQYSAMEVEYFVPICHGAVDPEVKWKEFKGKAAPLVKKIQIELQKQIDAFLKSK